ncbi:MAG: precorrin-6y C5,15-methyltransferase (decarboxylating) subunit CbiE [Pseudomonadota bacterium]
MKSDLLIWQGEPIAVVSLGCGRSSALSQPAIDTIANAEIIIGAPHHLEEVAHIHSSALKLTYPSPFSLLRETLEIHMGKSIAVLASGDALFYGVGSWLNRLVGNQNLVSLGNVSSIQTAFHAVALPWQSATVVSLHGRPLSTLNRHLTENAMLAVFTDGTNTPAKIGAFLQNRGYGASTVWLCEALGDEHEAVTRMTVGELVDRTCPVHDLNLLLVLVKADSVRISLFPGIPDHQFETGAAPGYGMITKREVRLTVLSMMQPQYGEVAWDIGAGCGSVSVEWARWNERGNIFAIESNPERCELIQKNIEKFGVHANVDLICGHAPDACRDLPQPDVIFIGGSDGALSDMLAFAWRMLRPGGKLVATAVTDKSREILSSFCREDIDAEVVSMRVEKRLPETLDSRELKPVTIVRRTCNSV